jgi:hypothetical protein
MADVRTPFGEPVSAEQSSHQAATFREFPLLFLQTFAPWRPPASLRETLRVTMWAGLRGTLLVSKRTKLREALRAGLGVRF